MARPQFGADATSSEHIPGAAFGDPTTGYRAESIRIYKGLQACQRSREPHINEATCEFCCVGGYSESGEHACALTVPINASAV